MADEPSLGELLRRFDRQENKLEDLLARLVTLDVYTRDQREVERRLVELRHEVTEETRLRREAIKDLRVIVDKQGERRGADWRQVIFSMLVPAALLMITVLVQIWLARGRT